MARTQMLQLKCPKHGVTEHGPIYDDLAVGQTAVCAKCRVEWLKHHALNDEEFVEHSYRLEPERALYNRSPARSLCREEPTALNREEWMYLLSLGSKHREGGDFTLDEAMLVRRARKTDEAQFQRVFFASE